MALFEVFIPTADPNGFDITARIRADSWINALRNGLSRLGDTADVQHIHCDITEEGIVVTEPRSGRVFRIREVPEGAPAAPAMPQVAAPVAQPPPPPPDAVPAPRLVAEAPRPKVRPALAARIDAALADEEAAITPTMAARQPVMPPPPPRDVEAPRFANSAAEEKVTRARPAAKSAAAPLVGRPKYQPGGLEETIAELFDSTQRIFLLADAKQVADLTLELAMRKVACESGAVLVADINKNDLYFLAARGPKAREVMSFRVPMGQGIAGFCAQEGVTLAVSDVQRDPRFYAFVSQSLGYETRSILCAPAQRDGRVYGAIELINKHAGSSFSQAEVEVVNYLARVFADYLESTGQTGE